MERAWIIISVLFLVGAGVFLLLQNYDAVLVTALLGVVAWFLSYRVKLRAAIVETSGKEDEAFEDQDEN
ncbi:MAG TPA: hypothetical protein VF791_14105 [Pyrinomonadaceae bacterium]